jgi:ribosomal protein S18 acetylase RimI-like enzyme
VSFTPQDQEETSAFMKTIYKEKGWTPRPNEGLDNLSDFFHLPNDGCLFLAKNGNEVIGTAGVTKIDNHSGLIKRVYVAKVFRNLGIGKQLIMAIINAAPKFGIIRLVLDVAKDNKPAIHLYDKFGFTKYDQPPLPGWPESSMPDSHYFYQLEIN